MSLLRRGAAGTVLVDKQVQAEMEAAVIVIERDMSCCSATCGDACRRASVVHRWGGRPVAWAGSLMSAQ
ncbi:MAG: hypothetical protein F4046_08855 [Acidimicrobiaceae bacterium]|nr:hypothetical protein [Acidimicrobiaceae bacterium]